MVGGVLLLPTPVLATVFLAITGWAAWEWAALSGIERTLGRAA
jgi:hypothetical protein